MGDLSTAAAAALSGRTDGPVWLAAGTSDEAGYNQERSGFDLSLIPRPAMVLGAVSSTDIAAGIRFAGENDLQVGLQATGHGIHTGMDGGLLITTRRLAGVEVDPVARTARIQAGATGGTVITAAAAHGLGACIGSAPGVGCVSYALGGGLGPLGRAFGYLADHVRRFDVVTADGQERTITRDQEPELFWALRGGGGNLAAVTAIEVDLQPVPEFYAGGLFYSSDRGPEVLDLFADQIADAPPELSLSIAFVTFPDLPVLPPPLRGQSRCHLRVAYLGSAEVGQRLIAPFRAAAPMLDTVAPMPLSNIGAIHGDPVGPMPANYNSLALSGGDLDRLLPFIGPDRPYMLEIRDLGGKLVDQPHVPTAVGHRAAGLNLFTSAYPGTEPVAAAAAQREVYAAVTTSSVGGPLRNFLPAGGDARTCYEPATADRLAALKAEWDPGDLFGFVPPIRAQLG